MEWDNTYYAKLEQASTYLKTKLGISTLDYWKTRAALTPYYYYIINHLTEVLINSGTEDLKSLIQLVLDTFEWGGDLIIAHNTQELGETIGLGDEFFHDYLDFCWGDFMSTLCLRLKFQYAYLFAQEPDGECCVCGARGQTETDYESWESGVYPEDECYDRSNYWRSTSAWGLEKDRFCECYRHSENS